MLVDGNSYAEEAQKNLDKTTKAVTGTHYYTFDNRPVAIRTTSAVTMVIDDHQGTASLQMGRTGLSPEQIAFVEPLAAVPVGLALGVAS